MPVDVVAAAVVATGYKGPMSLEVFNNSLNQPGAGVPSAHARRGFTGLRKLADAIPQVPAFWEEMWQHGRHKFGGSVISPRIQRL